MSDDDVTSIKADLRLMEWMLAVTLGLQVATLAITFAMGVELNNIAGQAAQISARLHS